MVVSGSEVVLSCSLYASPQATISWFFRDQRITNHAPATVENSLPNRKLGQSLVESRLRIPCVDVHTAGEYTCTATTPCTPPNLFLSASAQVMIAPTNKVSRCNASSSFDSPNPSPSSPFISQFTVSRLEMPGGVIQLMCRAQGNPQPEVTWHRLGEAEELIDITNHHSYMKLSNGDLLVMGDDDKVTESFRCTAKNQHGEDTADSTIIYINADEN
ncbi:hypothetical protein WR25_19326 [Diploscapter pachys]|uniref:Ig-like domain-containing protein n=1 Tax=Diploscapter pachys TaxID=2018661 RepID=A0A2A2JUR0_9BILA|nr:hypothetical protein WR25_19326 [Diploscapter pachys]